MVNSFTKKLKESLVEAEQATKKMTGDGAYTEYVSISGLLYHSDERINELGFLVADFIALLDDIYVNSPVVDYTSSVIFKEFGLADVIEDALESDEIDEETLLLDYINPIELVNLGIGAINRYMLRKGVRGNFYVNLSDGELGYDKVTVDFILLFTVTENGSRVKYCVFDTDTYSPSGWL